MPVYSFKNTETDEEFDMLMSFSEREEYLKENTNIISIITKSNIVASVGGIKNDDGFNEVLSKISEAHPKSALAEKHRKKSIKEIKTNEVIKKHMR